MIGGWRNVCAANRCLKRLVSQNPFPGNGSVHLSENIFVSSVVKMLAGAGDAILVILFSQPPK
jgi:hypothetical protein